MLFSDYNRKLLCNLAISKVIHDQQEATAGY